MSRFTKIAQISSRTTWNKRTISIEVQNRTFNEAEVGFIFKFNFTHYSVRSCQLSGKISHFKVEMVV